MYIAIRIGVGAGLLVVVTATVVLTAWYLVKCGVCCALDKGALYVCCFTLHCKFPKICDYEFCKFPNTHLLVCYELCCMYSSLCKHGDESFIFLHFFHQCRLLLSIHICYKNGDIQSLYTLIAQGDKSWMHAVLLSIAYFKRHNPRRSVYIRASVDVLCRDDTSEI